MLDEHGGAGYGSSHRIPDDPADDAGGRLGLRGGVRRAGKEHREQGEQRSGSASDVGNPGWPHGRLLLVPEGRRAQGARGKLEVWARQDSNLRPWDYESPALTS